MQYISSQRFLDESVVSDKLANRDFVVYTSPEFEVDGDVYRVITDGHHSLEAAKRAGVDPEFVEQTGTDNDTICLLEAGNFEEFLVVQRGDSDFYDVNTGRDIW